MSRCPVSIAIVLPAWQVARWLPETLAALEGQTFRGWVCHAVDDGSCDGTGELLDAAVRRDGRYWVCHQPNAGVSVARNRALAAIGAARDKAFSREGRQGPADDSVTCVTESRRLRGAHHDEPAGEFTTSETSSLRTQGEFTRKACGARGERARYIAFLDGDDVPLPRWFEAFAEIAAESGAQIIRQGCRLWQGGAYPSFGTSVDFRWRCVKGKDCPWTSEGVKLLRQIPSFGALWLHIFRADLLPLLENPERMVKAEDVAVTLRCLCHAESVALGTYDGYLYRQRSGSAMHGAYHVGQSTAVLGAAADLLECCRETHGGDVFAAAFRAVVGRMGWGGLLEGIDHASAAERERLRECFRRFVRDAGGEPVPEPKYRMGAWCFRVLGWGGPLRLTRTLTLCWRRHRWPTAYADRRTVLFFIPCAGMGGIAKAFCALLPVLEEAGYAVRVLLENPGDLASTPIPERCIAGALPVPRRLPGPVASVLHLFHWLTRWHFRFLTAPKIPHDLFVHYHAAGFAPWCFYSSAPTLAWLHGLPPAGRTPGLLGRFWDRCVRRAYERVARMVAVSDAVADGWMARYGLSRRPSVLPNLIAVSDGGRPGGSGHPEVPRCVCVARLSSEKGVGRLLRIAIGLLRAGERFTLDFVGDGPLREEMESLLDRAPDVRERIRLCGSVPDAAPFIRRADLLINASHEEGAPLVLQEALRLGTPVLATDVGGSREAVGGSSGAVFVEDDDAALGEALRRLVRSLPARVCADFTERDRRAREALLALIRETLEGTAGADVSKGV